MSSFSQIDGTRRSSSFSDTEASKDDCAKNSHHINTLIELSTSPRSTSPEQGLRKELNSSENSGETYKTFQTLGGFVGGFGTAVPVTLKSLDLVFPYIKDMGVVPGTIAAMGAAMGGAVVGLAAGGAGGVVAVRAGNAVIQMMRHDEESEIDLEKGNKSRSVKTLSIEERFSKIKNGAYDTASAYIPSAESFSRAPISRLVTLGKRYLGNVSQRQHISYDEEKFLSRFPMVPTDIITRPNIVDEKVPMHN